MTVAAEIYESLGPFRDDDETGDLQAFIEALTDPIELLDQIVAEGDDSPAWAKSLHPATCPAPVLPWLAQFLGVRLTPNMTVTEQRTAIQAREGSARGRVATIRSAVQRTLTGEKQVLITERDGDPYKLTVETSASETPDPTVTLAAIMGQKPAGLTVTYLAGLGAAYSDFAAKWSEYTNVTATGATYDGILALLG